MLCKIHWRNQTKPNHETVHITKRNLSPGFTGRTKLVFSWSITRNSEDRGFNWERSHAYVTMKLNHRSSFLYPPWNFCNLDFFFILVFKAEMFWGICNPVTQRNLASLFLAWLAYFGGRLIKNPYTKKMERDILIIKYNINTALSGWIQAKNWFNHPSI